MIVAYNEVYQRYCKAIRERQPTRCLRCGVLLIFSSEINGLTSGLCWQDSNWCYMAFHTWANNVAHMSAFDPWSSAFVVTIWRSIHVHVWLANGAP